MARGGYCAGTKRLRRRLSPVRKPSETGAIPGAESMFSGRCRRFPGRAPPRTVLLEARSARSARSGAIRPAGARWKSRSGPSPLPDAETIPGAESIFSVSCGRPAGVYRRRAALRRRTCALVHVVARLSVVPQARGEVGGHDAVRTLSPKVTGRRNDPGRRINVLSVLQRLSRAGAAPASRCGGAENAPIAVTGQNFLSAS